MKPLLVRQPSVTTSALPPILSGGLPVLGHAAEFLRDPVALMTRGEREHGNIFRMRVGSGTGVALLGEEHSRFFFRETDERLSLRVAYPFVLQMFDPGFYFFADREEYQRQRGILLPQFNGHQLSKYVEEMASEVAVLERTMGASGELDLTSTFGPVVMRIAVRTLYDEKFGAALGGNDFRRFREFSEGIRWGILPPSVPTPRRFRGRRAKRVMAEQLTNLIDNRRREPIDPPDFLQSLVEARYEDGRRVPDDVLINMLFLLTWAGHETTTGHLSWGLIHLLQNPAALARVHEEQRSVLGGADVPTFEQASQMRYLDNALHETERLSPTVFVQLRIAEEDIEYGGFRIPKNAMVFASPPVSHRLAETYPEPDSFLPERFESDPKLKTNLIGFGGGVHRCLGVHFAYLEMKIVLSLLLRHYDFELIDQDPQPIRGPKTKWPASPCRVKYTLRP
jgi:sterol 14-demethylase